jgi:hypothetical protein
MVAAPVPSTPSPGKLRNLNIPAAALVRLDVSARAAREKVFETLLADNELTSDQSPTNMTQKAPAGNFNRPSVQLPQGGRGGGQSPDRPQILAANKLGQALGSSPSGSAESATSLSVIQQQSSKPMIYQFDASSEQLRTIIKQIGERSDSFSVVEIVGAASPGANSSTETWAYGANNYGGLGGGRSADLSGQQQDAKADAGGVKFSREETAQPQAARAPVPHRAKHTASPAVSAARQHVVFVLNVVDRLPPAAGVSPAPAAAVPPGK